MSNTTWLLTQEAADYARMSYDSMQKLLDRGEIRSAPRRKGQRYRTTTKWVDDYLLAGEAA